MSLDTGLIWLVLLVGSWSWLSYCRWQDRSAEEDLREWLSTLEVDRQRHLRELREAQAAERWIVRERPRRGTVPHARRRRPGDREAEVISVAPAARRSS